MPPKTLTIAILECDTPIAPVQERYGSYGDIFERFLRRSLPLCDTIREDVDLVVTKWPVVERQRYPCADEADAILLTGSKYNAFDNDPWIVSLTAYVREILNSKNGTPIVGICFGHQIAARALGATVARNPEGWEVAVDEIRLGEMGKTLFGRETLSLHQMHHDIVNAPLALSGGKYEILGSSPKCAIQGLYAPGRFLTMQGHPEFDWFITSHVVESRYRMGVFGEELYVDAKARAGLEHDGLRVGRAVIGFVWGSRL